MSHDDSALSLTTSSFWSTSGTWPSLGSGGSVDDATPLPEPVDGLPADLVCVSCHQLMRRPCQTPCGHRICSSCVGKLSAEHGTTRFQCPAREEGCEEMTVNEITPDFSATRLLRLLVVYCINRRFGCDEVLQWQKLADHVESKCRFNKINCPNGCGADQLPTSQLEEHLRCCPLQPRDCIFASYGCSFTGPESQLESHYDSHVRYHMELLVERVLRLEVHVVSMKASQEGLSEDVRQVKTGVTELRRAIDTIQRELNTSSADLKASQDNIRALTSGLSETCGKLEVMTSRLESEMHTEMTTARDLIARFQSQLDQLRTTNGRGASINVPEPVRVQLNAHDRTLGIHDVRLAEMDLRIQCAETTNHDGVLIWKVGQYARRKRDAASGGTLSLYSQPFYTSRYGYKMCARVYLNGDGAGRGTHISFFFVVMQGDYDELLTWPFRQRVTLSLLDQRTQRRHLADIFRPDPSSTSFQKPTSPMNVASGCPLFIEHSKLEASDSPYLVNDILYFKITVDTSDLMQP